MSTFSQTTGDQEIDIGSRYSRGLQLPASTFSESEISDVDLYMKRVASITGTGRLYLVKSDGTQIGSLGDVDLSTISTSFSTINFAGTQTTDTSDCALVFARADGTDMGSNIKLQYARTDSGSAPSDTTCPLVSQLSAGDTPTVDSAAYLKVNFTYISDSPPPSSSSLLLPPQVAWI